MSNYITLHKLIHLVEKKNEVNRRRRRFYYILSTISTSGKTKQKWAKEVKYASEGYFLAQYEAKTYTPEIRKLRKQANAKLVWNAGGMVTDIKVEGRTIHHKEFKSFAAEYLMMRDLLGEG